MILIIKEKLSFLCTSTRRNNKAGSLQAGMPIFCLFKPKTESKPIRKQPDKKETKVLPLFCFAEKLLLLSSFNVQLTSNSKIWYI